MAWVVDEPVAIFCGMTMKDGVLGGEEKLLGEWLFISYDFMD